MKAHIKRNRIFSTGDLSNHSEGDRIQSKLAEGEMEGVCSIKSPLHQSLKGLVVCLPLLIYEEKDEIFKAGVLNFVLLVVGELVIEGPSSVEVFSTLEHLYIAMQKKTGKSN